MPAQGRFTALSSMSNIEILFFTHKLFSFLEINKEKIPNILSSNKGRLKRDQENISSEFALPNVQQSNRGQGWTNASRHRGKSCNCKANTCRVKGEPSHLRASRDRFIYAWLIYMPGVKGQLPLIPPLRGGTTARETDSTRSLMWKASQVQ